jgi:hypothetical protein
VRQSNGLLTVGFLKKAIWFQNSLPKDNSEKEYEMIIKHYIQILAFFLCFAGFTSAWAESNLGLSKGQTIYVPVYSHIYSGDKERKFELTTILSVRNTDTRNSITIKDVSYYDTEGNFLKKFVTSPISLNPLDSQRFVVGESDRAGGSGAKFIVKWGADLQVNIPIIESVMIGTQMGQGISFTSRGQQIIE